MDSFRSHVVKVNCGYRNVSRERGGYPGHSKRGEARGTRRAGGQHASKRLANKRARKFSRGLWLDDNDSDDSDDSNE